MPSKRLASVLRALACGPGATCGCTQGVKDPEAKRKIIGSGFIDVFNEYAARLQEKLGTLPRFLVQARSVAALCTHDPTSTANAALDLTPAHGWLLSLATIRSPAGRRPASGSWLWRDPRC